MATWPTQLPRAQFFFWKNRHQVFDLCQLIKDLQPSIGINDLVRRPLSNRKLVVFHMLKRFVSNAGEVSKLTRKFVTKANRLVVEHKRFQSQNENQFLIGLRLKILFHILAMAPGQLRPPGHP